MASGGGSSWSKNIIDKFLKNSTTPEEERRLLDYNEVENQHFGTEETSFNGEPDYNYSSTGVYEPTTDIGAGEETIYAEPEPSGPSNQRNPYPDGLRRRGGTRGEVRIPPTEETRIGSAVASGIDAAVGGTVSSTSAVGAGSSLAAPTLLASAAVGATAVGIGGYLTEKLANERGYTLPGSDYVGPGNSIPIEAAKNPVDQIARDHDLQYQEIKDKFEKGHIDRPQFEAEIKKADEEAASRFAEESGLHAVIGKIGLDAKQTVEKLTGVLYPSVTEIEDKQEESDQTAEETSPDNDDDNSMPPVGKQAAADSASDTSDAPKSKKRKLAGTAQDQGSSQDVADNATTLQRLPSPLVSVHSHIRYYRKVHRVLTYGLAYRAIQFKLGTADNSRFGYVLSTPLCEIPWDRLFLYINQGEYNILPRGATVNKVRCEVRTRNVRIAFPTNSTDNNLATLNQNKSTVHAVGLNVSLTTMPIKYNSFEASQPMIPTSVSKVSDSDYYTVHKNMYGRNGDITSVPRHQCGIPQVFPIYLGMMYAPFDSNQDLGNIGWECLQEKTVENLAEDAMSRELVSVEYEPLEGLCKTPITSKWFGIPQAAKKDEASALSVNYGPSEQAPQARNIGINSNSEPYTYRNVTLSTDQNGYFGLTQKIERCQEIWRGIYPNSHPRVQPSLHVGVQPTVALSTKTLVSDDSNNSFTDTQGYFDIIAEMEINTQFPVYRPHINDCITGEGDFYVMRATTDESAPTFAGLYQQ